MEAGEEKRHEKIPREKQRMKMGVGERKKSAKFWAVRRRAVRRRAVRRRVWSRGSAQILDAHEKFEHTPPTHHTTTQHNTTGDPAQVLGKGFSMAQRTRHEQQIVPKSSPIGQGCCKDNTSKHSNSRTNGYVKWLRKSVYNEKHTLNKGEIIVDNNVNDATHVDMRNMQN